MKKILLLASIITFSNLMAQSTATNFTANDCAEQVILYLMNWMPEK